jgi:peptidoglycan/xylan/chitin deacetylase (PgdA/CDA1 family)
VTLEPPRRARDFTGYGRFVPRVRWPEDARVAVNIHVNYEEGAEYTAESDGRNEAVGEFLMGLDPATPDLATQSTFEYGSRAGVWRLARMLDEYEVPATFNVAAVALEQNPQLAEYIRERGHEPCCHGWRFEELWLLDRDQEREHLHRAVETIHRLCGERPRGWCSRLMPSPHTRELLVEEGGFLYDSDALNDDLPYFVDVGATRHLVIPLSFTYNDGRFILGGADDPMAFFSYLKHGLNELWREGETEPRMMTVSLHARIIGQAGRAAALRAFLEHARELRGVWFARRVDIARWWIEHHTEFEAS